VCSQDATLYEAHFARSASESPSGKAVHASNLIAKAVHLVTGSHIVAMRLRPLVASTLLVFVTFASFYGGVYFTALEMGHGVFELLNHYCTCFAGRATCIHTAAAIMMLARLKKVDFDGALGLNVIESSQISILDRAAAHNYLTWVEQMKLFQDRLPSLTVHPNNLVARNFAELKQALVTYRRAKHLANRARGARSVGDILDGLTITKLRQFAFVADIPIAQLEEAEHENGGKTSKAWFRATILAQLANMPDHPQHEDAVYQRTVLDVCPCGVDGCSAAMAQCPHCRQWIGTACAGVADPKQLKKCERCEEVVAAAEEAQADGGLFFENDLSL